MMNNWWMMVVPVMLALCGVAGGLVWWRKKERGAAEPERALAPVELLPSSSSGKPVRQAAARPNLSATTLANAPVSQPDSQRVRSFSALADQDADCVRETLVAHGFHEDINKHDFSSDDGDIVCRLTSEQHVMLQCQIIASDALPLGMKLSTSHRKDAMSNLYLTSNLVEQGHLPAHRWVELFAADPEEGVTRALLQVLRAHHAEVLPRTWLALGQRHIEYEHTISFKAESPSRATLQARAEEVIAQAMRWQEIRWLGQREELLCRLVAQIEASQDLDEVGILLRLCRRGFDGEVFDTQIEARLKEQESRYNTMLRELLQTPYQGVEAIARDEQAKKEHDTLKFGKRKEVKQLIDTYTIEKLFAAYREHREDDSAAYIAEELARRLPPDNFMALEFIDLDHRNFAMDRLLESADSQTLRSGLPRVLGVQDTRTAHTRFVMMCEHGSAELWGARWFLDEIHALVERLEQKADQRMRPSYLFGDEGFAMGTHARDALVAYFAPRCLAGEEHADALSYALRWAVCNAYPAHQFTSAYIEAMIAEAPLDDLTELVRRGDSQLGARRYMLALERAFHPDQGGVVMQHAGFRKQMLELFEQLCVHTTEESSLERVDTLAGEILADDEECFGTPYALLDLEHALDFYITHIKTTRLRASALDSLDQLAAQARPSVRGLYDVRRQALVEHARSGLMQAGAQPATHKRTLKL